MRIRILSDLHLNHHAWTAPDVPADMVVLAGDISNGADGMRWARDTFRDTPLVYVAGNQECYGHNIDELIPELRCIAQENGVHFLEQDVLLMGGLRILGATLWTDFNLFGNSEYWLSKEDLPKRKSDACKSILTNTGIFSPVAMAERHHSTVRWLKSELDRDFSGKTIVVTHHVPTRQGLPSIWRNENSSAAFASHLETLFPQVDTWICGHTHAAADFQSGRCRVVINPRGRSAENCNGFNPELVLEV